MRYYHSAALAPSTISTHLTAYTNYHNFCGQCYFITFPLHPSVLQIYVTSLARRVAYKTIKIYLAGIQYHSNMLGYTEQIAAMVPLHYLLRGIRRTQGILHNRPRRLPITMQHMMQMFRFIENSSLVQYDQVMLQSVITLAFFGLLRSAEYVSSSPSSYDPTSTLLVSDIRFAADRRVAHINIKTSKTDPFKTGCIIRVGAIGGVFCPLQNLLRHLHQHRDNNGPLFSFFNGTLLTRRYISNFIQTVLPNSNLNTHSFRIGGASAAAAAGIPDSSIQLLGRWSSDAYRRYIHLSDDAVIDFSRRMYSERNLNRFWDAATGSSQNGHL